MKRLIGLMLFLLVATLSFATGEEKQYTLQDVPNVRLSDVRQYVSDPSHILSAPARDTINAVLARLEESTGIETAVVMLPSIGEEDIFNFGHELFRQWGIGKQKSNNGLLILFVADQRKVRFTVGYGLEGTMTDAMSKRIQMQRMVPRFKAGDWDGGMVDGVRAAAQVLDGSMQPEPTDDDEDMLVGIIALLIIIGIAIFVIFLVGEAQRCPKCRKKGVKRVAQQVLRLSNGRRVRRTTFLCPHCGHTFTRDENIDDSGNAAAFIAGAMLGGGGRGGGGGFSGGSFGGGSTGGGGSTSGW